ncbi:ash family protein [Acerihabitans sp. TG2]|nr:ash family protein [Acerihabitans sp. TG2]MEA9391684.1 ash family protein [Acerihabitans sp. TG2]
MVGWAGAPQGAPVSSMAGNAKPAQSTTHEIGISGVVVKKIHTGGCLMTMATIPTQTHALLSIPFDSTTDFTVLAGHCENLADALLQNDDPAQRQALCRRLTDCLAQLLPTLDDPIPPHLIDSLTVDDRPMTSPCFEPDADLLCGYSQALAQLLSQQTLSPEMEPILSGLLFDLVVYFAEELRAPRWVRTAEGVKFIEELDRVQEYALP